MTRLTSGLVMAAVVVAAIWWLPTAALRLLALAVAVVALVEFVGIARTLGAQVSLAVALTGTVVCFAAASYPAGLDTLTGVGLLVVVFGAVVLGASGVTATLLDFGTLLAAAVYIGVPLGQLVALHAGRGRYLVLLVLATVVVSDTAQYYAGRTFGRHLLAPAVSPKKTVEGAAGGLVGGVLLMATAGAWVLPGYPAWLLGFFGAALVAVGIGGDLFESKLKRAAGVKDSGSLIPGHGGVLDRIDALLFVIPVFYAFLALTAERP